MDGHQKLWFENYLFVHRSGNMQISQRYCLCRMHGTNDYFATGGL